MKKAFFAIIIALPGIAFAQTYVAPHIRSDGTMVQGHYRSAPDNTRINNYSTQGNYNPYTGQQGHVDPYALPQPQPAYQQQRYPNDNSYLNQYRQRNR